MKKIQTVAFFFRLIWQANKFYLLSITILPALSWLQSMIGVIFTKRLLDNLENASIIGGGISAAIMLFSFFFISVIQESVSAKQTVAGQDLHTKMRTLLADKYVSLPYHITCRHDRQEEYEMAVKCVDESYAEAFVSKVLSIVFGIGTIGSLLYLLREFPIWLLALFAVVLIVDVIVYIKQADLLYANYVDETPIERGLYYARGGLMRLDFAKEIRLYGLKDFISQKTEASISAFYDQCEKSRKLEMRKALWSYLAEAIQFVGIYALAILEYYKNKAMTIGEFSLILTSTTKFSQVTREIASDGVSIYKNIRYVEMLEDFLKITYDKGCDVSNINPTERHYFKFDHVSFQYDGSDNEVLQDINIEFYSDEKISVVGDNGAGKTTFVLLLLGFLKPTKGQILIDGINIDKVEREKYIHIFSPVFQDYVIYNTDIKDNITLSLDYDKDLFVDCTKNVELDLDRFPQDEQTNIGNIYEEDGVELSGGESQKVALARAIYKQSAMFIFDEPTAALDPRAECDLYLNFSKIADKRGCIFISHRLASCKLCEKIFVFDKGNLIETGSHEALMRDKGVYHSMFTAQSEKFFDNSEDEV